MRIYPSSPAEHRTVDAKSLLVVYSIGYPAVSWGVVDAMTKRLQDCGIQSRHVAVNSLYDAFNKPDREKIVAEAVQRASGFAYDSVLDLIETGVYSDARGRALTFYSVELHQRGAGPAVWTGSVALAGNSGTASQIVNHFTGEIINRLGKDKVIAGCVPSGS